MNQFSLKHSVCPHCCKSNFIKKGHFYKKITKTYIPRYKCLDCKVSFSTRTKSITFKQRRPDLNESIYLSLVSGVSMRKTAKNLKCSYMTVVSKFRWLSQRAQHLHSNQKFNIKELQFDEMESIEHTKLKPLTICLAVSDDYQILGAKVGKIPAKGHLSSIAYRKYGPRENESEIKMRELFCTLKDQLIKMPEGLKSDAKASYKSLAKDYFPYIPHQQYVSRDNKEKRRELKYTAKEKRIFDPLFALNQRCAKLRDHIKRLTRKSWCTTKIPEQLEAHLALYIAHNNNYKMF